jgi:lysophospholipase L1-like esterase
MSILPRRNMEDRINLLNKLISTIPFNKRIKFANASKVFLQPSSKIDESLFSDGLHPNTVGYEKLGAFIDTQIGK